MNHNEMEVAMKLLVGSRLYGLNDQNSDYDERVVLYDHPDYMFGTERPFEVETANDGTDTVYYSLRHFFGLCLKGNPTMLETLFVPVDMVHQGRVFYERLALVRDAFLSKNVRAPYFNYALSQRNLVARRRVPTGSTHDKYVNAYGYDTKAASHLLRLCVQGTEVLTTGYMDVRLQGENLAMCRAVKFGQVSYEEFDKLVGEKLSELENAKCVLPDQPSRGVVNKFLTGLYMERLCQNMR
jgi:uncharacterized protein